MRRFLICLLLFSAAVAIAQGPPRPKFGRTFAELVAQQRAGAKDDVPIVAMVNSGFFEAHQSQVALDSTRATHDALVGRALGRALAHELGHYVLQTKAHSTRGLMRASWPSGAFLSPDDRLFTLSPSERADAWRLTRLKMLDRATRATPPTS